MHKFDAGVIIAFQIKVHARVLTGNLNREHYKKLSQREIVNR